MQINANMGHHLFVSIYGLFVLIFTEREGKKEKGNRICKGPQDAAVQWEHCPQMYLFLIN